MSANLLQTGNTGLGRRTSQSPVRVDFSKIATAVRIPNLIEIQRESYNRFLQMDLLTEERDRHAEVVSEILGLSCVEIKRNPPRAEREIVNLACLIERDGQERFEAAVFEAATRFDNNYAFDYNGPWAPHNYVDLALDL